MYAIIETGGKQVRVEVGSKIYVEKLDAEVGSTITLDKVLLIGDKSVLVGDIVLQLSRLVLGAQFALLHHLGPLGRVRVIHLDNGFQAPDLGCDPEVSVHVILAFPDVQADLQPLQLVLVPIPFPAGVAVLQGPDSALQLMLPPVVVLFVLTVRELNAVNALVFDAVVPPRLAFVLSAKESRKLALVDLDLNDQRLGNAVVIDFSRDHMPFVHPGRERHALPGLCRFEIVNPVDHCLPPD